MDDAEAKIKTLPLTFAQRDKVKRTNDLILEFIHVIEAFEWLKENGELRSDFNVIDNTLNCISPFLEDREKLRLILIQLAK